MRILVTGVTGFAGAWLAEALLARGNCRLAGTSRSGCWSANCCHLSERVRLYRCDLTQTDAVEKVLRQADPEQIYHLAGYPHTGLSFKEPDAAWEGNLSATRCLYDAVLRWRGRPRILAVSSGLIYGDPRPGETIHEETPLRPSSPYAASKAAADLVSYQYAVAHQLPIVRARPFNHFGPRQTPDFAVPNFARQLAEILRGTRPPFLETGDLSAQRDLSDVRDVAAAYLLLMEKGRDGEAYNIASGSSQSMQAILDALVHLAGVRVQVHVREDLLRPTEPLLIQVSTNRLRTEIGWWPRFTMEQTLNDILAYWSQSV
jgi:GDP-4-dehydro-6-deoxy-D-mannose reductase